MQQRSAGKRSILIRPRIGNKKLEAAKQGETRHPNCPDSNCAAVKAAAVHSNHCMAPCSAVYRLRGSQLPCNGEMLPAIGRKAERNWRPKSTRGARQKRISRQGCQHAELQGRQQVGRNGRHTRPCQQHQSPEGHHTWTDAVAASKSRAIWSSRSMTQCSASMARRTSGKGSTRRVETRSRAHCGARAAAA